jgi:hypothetical protein
VTQPDLVGTDSITPAGDRAGIVNDAGIAAVRGQASEIARGWSSPGAPASWALTAAVFDALARDDELLALAADVPEGKMPALLSCASACYLIADREPERLIGYFPTAGRPQPPLDAAFEPAFRAFCLDHRDELAAVCARRRYQMNDVARTTQVALARAHRPHRPARSAVGAGVPAARNRVARSRSSAWSLSSRGVAAEVCSHARIPRVRA